MTFIRAAAFWFLTVLPVMADEITLKSRDGAIEFSGTLLGFDGNFYRLDTIYGELTVDGSDLRCDGVGCPNLENYVAEISVSGSALMGAVLFPALLEGFARRDGYQLAREPHDSSHVSYRLTDATSDSVAAIFRVRETNSDEGFADMLANEADLVMSLREITELEQIRATEAGMGNMTDAYRERVLALDAFVPIVSNLNPIRVISPAQLAKIFIGDITNWSAIGGPDAPIAIHVPSNQTGFARAAAQLLEPVATNVTVAAIRHLRGDELAEAVHADPFALGLVSFAEVGSARPLALQGSCGRMLQASQGSIKSEGYPLIAPMFLYTPARRLPEIGRDFVSFLEGPTAQAIIRRAGFVDQALEEVPIDVQGNRLANAIVAAGPEVSLAELQRLATRLLSMERLTLSFRFEADRVELDALSRTNTVRLARDVERGLFDARQMLFVGFTDGEGPAPQNRRTAYAMAEAVRDGVLTAANILDPGSVDVGVDAFGEAMPLACDDSAWGRGANRRVEVWVR